MTNHKNNNKQETNKHEKSVISSKNNQNQSNKGSCSHDANKNQAGHLGDKAGHSCPSFDCQKGQDKHTR